MNGNVITGGGDGDVGQLENSEWKRIPIRLENGPAKNPGIRHQENPPNHRDLTFTPERIVNDDVDSIGK